MRDRGKEMKVTPKAFGLIRSAQSMSRVKPSHNAVLLAKDECFIDLDNGSVLYNIGCHLITDTVNVPK